MWQLVKGIRHQTQRLATEAERMEVQRELQELQEEAEGHCKELSIDSESSGSWRTDLEPEEQSLERWRSTIELELEGSGPEGEKEVESQMTLH